MYTEFYWLDLHGPDNGQISTAIRPSQTEILFHRPESCNRYLITLYLLFYRLKIFQMFIKPTRLMKFLIFWKIFISRKSLFDECDGDLAYPVVKNFEFTFDIHTVNIARVSISKNLGLI